MRLYDSHRKTDEIHPLPHTSADAKAYFHYLEVIARVVARHVSDGPAE